MVTSVKISKSILYASLLTFISFVVYILYINQEVLYMAHSRSEFLLGEPFLRDTLAKPFGIMQYAGAWLAQFLYNPALGSILLAIIWLLIYWVGTKAFRLKESAAALMLLPVACLLTSVVDLGYWIYFIAIRGYWFSQSLAYLIMLLLLWAARSTPRKYHLAWYLFSICLYPVLGWYSLLFVLCLVFTDKLSWNEFFGLFSLLFVGNIWRVLLYSNQKLEVVLLGGLPQFSNPADVTERLSTPFWVLGAVSVLIPLCSRFLTKNFVPAICALAGMVFTWSFMFQDRTYIDEMRMVRNAEDDNWEEVLNLYAENPKPTLSMVMLKNIALMNEGDVLNRSFQMGNDATPMYNPDSIHVSFLEIAAPIAYYNYGMINEGFRLSFECAEQSGFSPFFLKMLCRCALANGEFELAQRYITLLHGHPYYATWKPAPVSQHILDLKAAYPDELTGVEHSYSYIVNSISLWFESDSKIGSEQALLYSMLRCDSRRFWASLRKFVKLHQGEEFPIHAQEAYIMFMDKAPEEKRMMMPVSQEVYDRYKAFGTAIEQLVMSGVNIKDVPEKMRAQYGDTYWYFNIFGKKIY